MEDQLKESQAKLDALQEQIIENKNTREELKVEARELRDAYIEEQKIRERLLAEFLSANSEEEE